ncbi:zinc transporter 9-like [Tropilaelaps mercedesae]|uniref:Proton-coupled zinc antiporter SLC30A9, mitochondrial n=1 Tax=Tropilaelaps mercedesae TaxID=418985 RepID=A0A1V9XZG4_9ACAR|nr:zinc transporter 9-like [Tropilaelaps mercedesae]
MRGFCLLVGNSTLPLRCHRGSNSISEHNLRLLTRGGLHFRYRTGSRACSSTDSDSTETRSSPHKINSSASQKCLPERKAISEMQQTIIKAIKGTRIKLDVNQEYTERNFITPIRAMTEYGLKLQDLEGLKKTLRRSPISDNPPITVFLRRDVESKALEVYGSREALKRAQQQQIEEIQRLRDEENLISKKILKEFYKAEKRNVEKKQRELILKGSGRVVHTAVAINAANCLFKTVAWLYSGSHSMFAEAVHSFADTLNQLILAFGIRKSLQQANPNHPYGYHNMRYVSSLISGVGIFFCGAGLAWYHGFVGLLSPERVNSLYWAFVILGGSLLSEGGTLYVAFREIRNGARHENVSMLDYIVRSRDPSVNVVLLEDIAAVLGVSIAASCLGLAHIYGNPHFDAMGSLLIGCILASVASFIIYTNTTALVGRSIPFEQVQRINRELESDVMIRAIYDVKATDMGNQIVRYKAEVDFDGRELTRSYIDTLDLEIMLQEVQGFTTIEELDAFMLKHGESIIDLLGAQVDRIERNLKQRHPDVRHVDLEVL